MRDFSRTASAGIRLDPGKRVNYTRGLVLGPDEFLQEQYYGLSKHRRHARALHGYGTVWGLRVSPPDAASATPEIQVSPGLAIDPCGREIEVPHTMCARIDEWLNANRASLMPSGGPPPAEVRLSVLLCYRECGTDTVPIVGEPCRIQEDVIQPSRIADSFELKLRRRDHDEATSLPGSLPGDLSALFEQPEEMAARAFGILLDRVEVKAGEPAGNYPAPEVFDEEVRRIAEYVGSGEADPTLPWPPADASRLLVRPEEAHGMFRRMVGVWITEVRPLVRSRQRYLDERTHVGGNGGSRSECCVLLGVVTVPIVVPSGGGDWVGGAGVEVDERERPLLVHTRLLQEWLIAGSGAIESAAGGGVPSTPGRPYRAVAAAHVTGDGALIGPSFNSVMVARLGGQEYAIRFVGYQPPSSGNHTYIVSGSPIIRTNPAIRTGYFRFVAFDAANVGIRVRVGATQGAPLTANDEFMFEISRIG